MTAKLLANQLKSLMNDPVEGFTVELVNDSSLYDWKVYLEGPKDTFYEGGVFQLLLTFPKDYPMSPPSLRFISEFWHPNVYQREGRVCISILHPPGEDATSGELPEERWLPTQTVPTIILSVMSILADPNTSSPANVDASVEWRTNREAYKKRVAKLVEKANKLKPSHIVIPHPDTNPEEHKKSVERMRRQEKGMDIDFLEDDDDDYNRYDDDEEEDDDEDDFDNDDNNDDDDDDNNDTTTEDDEVEEKVTQVKSDGDKPKVDSSNYNITIQTQPSIVSTTSTTTTTVSTPSPVLEITPTPTTSNNNSNNVNPTLATNNNSSSTTNTTNTQPVANVTVPDTQPINNTNTNNTNNSTTTSNTQPNITNTETQPPPANNNTNNNNATRLKKKSKKCIIM